MALKSPTQLRVKLLLCSQSSLRQKVTVQEDGDSWRWDQIKNILFDYMDEKSLNWHTHTLRLSHISSFIEPVMRVSVEFVFLGFIQMDFVHTFPLVALRQVPAAS